MSRVRALFDAQTFLRQRSGGISRLFADLIAEFDSNPELGVEAVLPFRWSNNRHLTEAVPDRHLRVAPVGLPRVALYGPAWLRGPGRHVDVDLIHHTYYSGRFLRSGGRHVTTVYDMIPELFKGTPQFTATHLDKRRYVESADLVICISESTRTDLIEAYGEVAAPIHVVPLAVSPHFRPGLDPIPGLPTEYLLYVGARAGYKDFRLLPQAIRTLRDNGTGIPVVVVGKPFTEDERAWLRAMQVAEQFIHVQLNDELLRRAYSNSIALVQTSRYEGFGLAPLEAMASGIPVVVARASSMPEVCGDVGRYFSPGDPDSLSQTLLTVLDGESRGELGKRGIERAASFTLARTAQLTAEAYRAIL